MDASKSSDAYNPSTPDSNPRFSASNSSSVHRRNRSLRSFVSTSSTYLSAAGIGNFLKTKASRNVNSATFTPIASARIAVATALAPGARRMARNAYRKSAQVSSPRRTRKGALRSSLMVIRTRTELRSRLFSCPACADCNPSRLSLVLTDGPPSKRIQTKTQSQAGTARVSPHAGERIRPSPEIRSVRCLHSTTRDVASSRDAGPGCTGVIQYSTRHHEQAKRPAAMSAQFAGKSIAQGHCRGYRESPAA